MDFLAEGAGAFGQVRIARQKFRPVQPQDGGAGAGGDDDVIHILKGRDRLADKGRGVLAVACIVGRLPATGLPPRHDDVAAGFFQKAKGGKAHLRADQIDKTGDKKAYANHW